MKRVRGRRKRLSRMTIFGVIILTLTMCGILGYKQNVLRAQSKEYAKQIQSLQEEKKELAQDKKDIEDLKDYVKTDEYVEEVARDKFGLVYKGEIIFEPEER